MAKTKAHIRLVRDGEAILVDSESAAVKREWEGWVREEAPQPAAEGSSTDRPKK